MDNKSSLVLKNVRESYGLSQKEMAEKLEIHYQTYRGYEKGSDPTVSVINRACKLFSVEPAQFFDEAYELIIDYRPLYRKIAELEDRLTKLEKTKKSK